MGQAVTPLPLTSPGYFGLNTQDSPTDMDQRFALQANNCVIDKSGRIACRKGWTPSHVTLAALGTANVECVTELVRNDGTTVVLAAGNNKLFKLSAGVLSELTYGGGGSAPTITANKWQTATISDCEVFFQSGHDPLVFDPTVSATTYRRISERASYAGTVQQGNAVLSAYGRLWVGATASNKNTVYWSDTQTNQVWTGGTAGSLNLQGVWPSGGDQIVAINAHNNQLIIFGRKQVLIYGNANDPSNLSLVDHIENMGCISRDTVQNTGEDIIFLSDSGVRSLMRTIQEKSAPLRTISRNVNDVIQQYVDAAPAGSIISGYSPSDFFYLLTFKENNITYCFDTRQQLENGANRVTTWSNITPKAYMYSQDKTLYLGQEGYVGTYDTFKDNTRSYRMSYYTGWIDFGKPIAYAILKKIRMVLVGGRSQTVIFKWGFDYISPIGSQSTPLGTTVPAQYNISEYAIAEYNADTLTSVISVNATGTGRVCQVGFESQVVEDQISIQKIDLYIKEGRV